MERPILVYVGGAEGQECSCLYLGTDGEKAQAVFEKAGNDGRNAVVRYCRFFEHTQIRTPKRDGVPVRSKRADGPRSPQGPATSESEADGDDSQDSGV